MFTNRLYELRGNMTQAEMAAILGMTQQNYGHYENGKQALRSDHIELICRKFNCSAEWLLCLDIDEKEDDGLKELRGLFAKMDPESRDALMVVARALAR